MSLFPSARRSGGILLITAAVLASVLTGCAPEAAPKPTTSPSTSSTPKPSATPTETPAAWTRFSDQRFTASFELPPGWKLEEQETPYADQGIFQLNVLDTAGKRQLVFLNGATGLGGVCSADSVPMQVEELDRQEVSLTGYAPATEPPVALTAPQFVYRAWNTGDGVVAATVALVNTPPVKTCFDVNLLWTAERQYTLSDGTQVGTHKELRPRTFANMDEAKAFMQTPEYATLKRIITSFQL
ncbi:hypothetical protein [Leucobacter iarius]|uniref:Lipoprotein n=1 Tax=Leucobacter iarius TaxID=333963 RepID=A0ABN2L8H4_9MICO